MNRVKPRAPSADVSPHVGRLPRARRRASAFGAVVIGSALLLVSQGCTKGAPPASLLEAGAPAESASAPADSASASQSAALAAPLDAGAPAPADDLQARAAKLWEAIVKDEPDLAMPMFYPRDAFIALKDVKDPGAYWDKLVKDFKAQIHGYHKKLGKKASEAELETLELNAKTQVYVAPKKELNKTGYNKVQSSKLRYKMKGKTRWFEIATMIDLEGKWYVTHLRK
jgi:hypothetical protein